MPKITRIEIAIDPETGVIGAQATLDNGRTVGLEAGANAEYGTTLTDALGEGMAQALAANADLAGQLADLTVERDQLQTDLTKARADLAKRRTA